ncbi:heme oxygenase [Aquimarina intermedia]|uniref:Heme oxygenase n=2 Tax=Aquimarina intermedia TaxID=350814 RepID=A0A5S5CDA3_9FLAO|nr:heme oxygenase [Aquimarina intermedia]
MLKILKEQTANLHQGVEQSNDAGLIMEHSIGLEAYRNLLQQNLRAYSTIENYINEHSDRLPAQIKQFVSTQKSAVLRKDLAQLSEEYETTEISLKQKPSPMQLIGMLYVIEGSMLGGMMISKHLPKCPALQEIKEHHFFGGDPKVHVARWKSFCATIEASDYNEHDINEAVLGANAAFNVFKQTYETPLVVS